MNLQTYYTKTLDRGLVTIPLAIRTRLDITKGQILKLSTDGTRLIIEPAIRKTAPYRSLSPSDIDTFLKEDVG